MSGSPTSRGLRVFRSVVCVYWLIEFTATHAPISEQVEQLPGTDKHLHLGAYFVLGALLMFWNGRRSASNWKHVLTVVAILAAYAAIDELLQIPVGRDADVLDWAADVGGAIAGSFAVCAVVNWLMPRPVAP